MKEVDSRVEEFDSRVEEFESSGGISGRGVKEYSRRVDKFVLLDHRSGPYPQPRLQHPVMDRTVYYPPPPTGKSDLIIGG